MIAVFAGPSLPPIARIRRDHFVYFPPASRGDIASAARHFSALIILDGTFHQALAPSPKEVFKALKYAPIVGGASMGAIRGAECAAFGLHAVGAIALWYRREVIDG